MEQATPSAPTPPLTDLGTDWFDPLEDAVRGQVRAFIERLLEEELEAALGRGRYARDLAAKAIATVTVSVDWTRRSGRWCWRCRGRGSRMSTRASANGRASCSRPTGACAGAPIHKDGPHRLLPQGGLHRRVTIRPPGACLRRRAMGRTVMRTSRGHNGGLVSMVGCKSLILWRARKDSNPQPPDP
jgi:hypothetical protein